MKYKALSASTVFAVALVLSLMSSTVYARSKALVEPQQVTLNCELAQKVMQSAIRSGGAVRNWTVAKQDPGLTELNYIKGANKHSINVNINYTKNTFAVTYKDSFNLNYRINKKGVKEIHPNAIKWMINLSSDIQRQANAQCFAD